MSTSHRGLPPPAAMALSGHSPSSNLNQLPDRWQHGSEETQRSFLQAKSDEEKRRQEEERTKQENYRLEIRRTELEMLREAFRGGIPPQLVPMIFTGGGGALASTSAEWANHYISQLNHNQQQLLQGNVVSPPDSRLESRLLTATEHQTPKSSGLSSISQTPAQSQAASNVPPGAAHNLHHAGSGSSSYSPFGSSGLVATRNHAQQIHTSEPPRSSLPRINTNEIHVQPPPQGPPPGLNMQLSGIPPPSQTPTQNLIAHQTPQSHISQTGPSESHRQPESSPIFFHHWQPPTTQPSTSAPATSISPASGKNIESSPFSNQPYASGSSGNANKRRGVNPTHNRHRSDSGSARGYEPYPKNLNSRPRRSDAGGDGVGVTGHFSISHMTGRESSPEIARRESTTKPPGGPHQESPLLHQQYQAGPDSRLESHRRKEREGSESHGGPAGRN
ncbi:hypothetical protein TWF970_009912 [Orbilia oligospora]|uniref:Uncharacterized protein n=1 Tax=Orbilia oligospora TaxID=2813651 RepID=A0A7C8VI41_ORBOL|nr:hypothetical protein TWF970_009912 [Orbilia oligospora]